MGRIVWTGTETDFVQLDVSDWRRGLYVIKTREETQKLILH